MPLTPAHEILAHARKHRYGIPCLLAGSLEMAIGQIEAAESVDAPLILAFNEGVTPQTPMALAMPMMVTAARRTRIPVATILDHGATLEAAVAAIQFGSSSVMYDGSAQSFEENIRCTREVVRVAHAAGVCVEGELGAIGGSSVELGRGGDYASSLTDPNLVVEYVERTGVDILAISFGNAHGIYSGSPRLDLPRVQEIAALVDLPLAMHGASGLPDDRYGPIVNSGISKINYYTQMARAVSHDLRDMLASAPEEQLVYHHIVAATIDGFAAKTTDLLELLGAAGKATAM